MHKTLTYSIFVVAGLAVTAAFITATSYTQLTAAILLYPLLVYFAFAIFPRRIKKQHSEQPVTVQALEPEVKSEELVEARKIDIADIDKRAFLKLIGGAGITLFLFSLFNKRFEGLFFKSAPASGASGSVSIQDSSGNKIDPAQRKPLDGYTISDIDTNLITYYGFISKDRDWYIVRVDTTTGTFRYSRSSSNYFDNWNNRAIIKYDFFDNVFSEF